MAMIPPSSCRLTIIALISSACGVSFEAGSGAEDLPVGSGLQLSKPTRHTTGTSKLPNTSLIKGTNHR